MPYSKRPLDVGEQIARLEKRGLLFTDKELAEQYLNNISYYRLRAYTFPFQNNVDESADHSFLRNDIDFMDIIDLYVFDRRLRSIIFNELEKIEVAVRTKLSLVYSTTLSDAFWYQNPNNFDSREMFEFLKKKKKKMILMEMSIEVMRILSSIIIKNTTHLLSRPHG